MLYKLKLICMKKDIGKILSVTVIFFLSVSCNFQYTKWDRNVSNEKMNFSRVRYSIQETDTTSIIGYLKNNTVINGYPCKQGWVHFTKDWQPKLFCLYKKSTVNNVQLRKGSWVVLNPGRNFFSVVFPNDTIVENFRCKGGGGVNGFQTSFYNSGKLKEFFTDENITIDHIECKHGIKNPIKLHENGKLCSCMLNKEITLNSTTFKAGTFVQLDSIGTIIINQ